MRTLVLPLRVSVTVESRDSQTWCVVPTLSESMFMYFKVDFSRRSWTIDAVQYAFTATFTMDFHLYFCGRLSDKSVMFGRLYFIRVSFTLQKKLLRLSVLTAHCLFTSCFMVEFSQLRTEYSKLSCLLSNSAATGRAPSSKYTAPTAVRFGRPWNDRRLPLWNRVDCLDWMY